MNVLCIIQAFIKHALAFRHLVKRQWLINRDVAMGSYWRSLPFSQYVWTFLSFKLGNPRFLKDNSLFKIVKKYIIFVVLTTLWSLHITHRLCHLGNRAIFWGNFWIPPLHEKLHVATFLLLNNVQHLICSYKYQLKLLHWNYFAVVLTAMQNPLIGQLTLFLRCY